MKSKAQILAEKIDKIFEKNGLKVKKGKLKKEGYFTIVILKGNSK